MALDELDSREPRRGLWIVLAIVILLLGLGAGLVSWSFNSDHVKARVADAVQRATGRTLTISGATQLEFSFSPTVSMKEVTLANPPGFSRPDMVKVARLEVGLALLPLLQRRVEIDHVTLIQPDILLETDAAGRANWVFSQGATPAAAASPAPAPAVNTAAKLPIAIWFSNASVTSGHVGWRDDKTGHSYEVDVPQLSLDAPIGGAAQLTGAVVYQGRTINLSAHAEPTEVPGSAPGTGPWPVDLKLETAGASLTVDGQIEHPLAGRGYTLAIDADVPDPSVVAALLPELPLARLKAVTAHAELSDSGGPNPTISTAQVKIGSVDLSWPGHGMTMENVTLGARGDGPIRLAAGISHDGFDSALNGNIGDLAWLAGGASGPVTIDLEWAAASARASVTGTIQSPMLPAGYALDVSVNVPKPSQVTDNAPAALRSVVLQTKLTDAPGPVPFQFTSNAGDLSGALAVSRLPKSSVARISVDGQVSSHRLDLDTLLSHSAPGPGGPGAAANPPASSGAGGGGTAPGAASPPAAGANAAPKEAPGAAAPSAGSATLIPDTKLPFDLIREAQGGVTFALADVRLHGAEFRNVASTLTIKDGQLRVDPFNLAASDQKLSGTLTADAAKTPTALHLTLNAPGVAVPPVLAMLGLPEVATGTASVHADLTGTGDTPHAIAASLNGWAGVAIENGQLNAKLVNGWLGEVQPLHLAGPDITELRCFAMRADVKSGIATLRPLAFNTPVLIVDGDGDVDLGHETLQLLMRPRARIGGTGIAVPVRLSGPMREPSARIDISGKAFGGGGGGLLGGLLLGGKEILGAVGGGDPCPEALARAREPAGPAASGGKP